MSTKEFEMYESPSLEQIYLEADCPVAMSNLESPGEGDIIEW